ncbi:MAG TPA: hypothetical protein EYP85_05800 [Armatimonadetes bacterium]|nr:hypothetical protein [Armatimonadota bacterium]
MNIPQLDRAVKERILRSLNHEEGDRVPIWDYIDNHGIVEYFRREGDDYAQTMVRVYHQLGIDLCRGYGGSFAEEQEGEVHRDGKVEHLISGRTRWMTKYPIQSLEELRHYRPEPVSYEWLRTEWVTQMRRQQELFAPYTLYVPGGGCGFHATYGLMGQELFSYAIYDARAEVERIMEVLNENCVRQAQVAAEEQLGPLYFIGDDLAYKGRLLFSPSFLRQTFIPCLRRCIEPLHAAGIKVIFHSDGYLMEILDDLLEAGIDGLNPIEPLAGMDIGLLKRRYGRRLVLVGNVDCSQLLPFGTRKEIIAAVKECLRQAAPGGGHFIGSSSEIVPATPVENILTFYEACREYGQYPLRL